MKTSWEVHKNQSFDEFDIEGQGHHLNPKGRERKGAPLHSQESIPEGPI